MFKKTLENDIFYYDKEINIMKQILTFCFMALLAAQMNIQAQPYSQTELPEILRADYDARVEFKDDLNITCSRAAKGNRILADEMTNINRRPYDVLSYDLYMDWTGPLTADNIDSVGRFYTGLNIIKVRIDSADLTEIEFDAVDIKIWFVAVDNRWFIETPDAVDGIVAIPLRSGTQPGDIVEIKIIYIYVGLHNAGFHLYKEGLVSERFYNGDSTVVEARLAYTMSEPMDARKWMPCNDASYDKAKASISVRVPDGFSVASNGLLQSIEEEPAENTKIYHWSDTTQIATYLMSANASKFEEHTEYYHRVSNPEDSIPVTYYMWAGDYTDTSEAETGFNAEYSYRNTVRMMEFFSEKFVEYPFNSYGHVTVQPFDYGGMEHQTLTTLIRSVIRKVHPDQSWSRDWNNQMIIAHELAHQWLGDYITAATWNDLWINEGGAVYSEVLWVGNDYGETGYNNHLMSKWRGYMYNWKSEYVGLKRHAIYDAPNYNLFDYGITYCKSGWVYHMLSSMLGEEQFLTTLRGLMEEYKYQSLETDQFRDFFKSRNPDPLIDFDTFFDQWIHHSGHPVYELSGSAQMSESSGWDMTLNVNQVQAAEGKILEVYQVPLTINFYHNDDIFHSETFINNQREQTFQVHLDHIPDSAKVDMTKILCWVNEQYVSVTENNEYANQTGNIYPNPLRIGTEAIYTCALPRQSDVQAVVVDMLGNTVKQVYSGFLPAGNYDFRFSSADMVSGMYMLRIIAGETHIVKKFSVCK